MRWIMVRVKNDLTLRLYYPILAPLVAKRLPSIIMFCIFLFFVKYIKPWPAQQHTGKGAMCKNINSITDVRLWHWYIYILSRSPGLAPIFLVLWINKLHYSLGFRIGPTSPIRRWGRAEGAKLPVARAGLPADASTYGEPAEFHDFWPQYGG